MRRSASHAGERRFRRYTGIASGEERSRRSSGHSGRADSSEETPRRRCGNCAEATAGTNTTVIHLSTAADFESRTDDGRVGSRADRQRSFAARTVERNDIGTALLLRRIRRRLPRFRHAPTSRHVVVVSLVVSRPINSRRCRRRRREL